MGPCADLMLRCPTDSMLGIFSPLLLSLHRLVAVLAMTSVVSRACEKVSVCASLRGSYVESPQEASGTPGGCQMSDQHVSVFLSKQARYCNMKYRNDAIASVS